MVLGIYGAGGLGRETLETVNQIQAIKKRWDKIYFVEDKQWHTEDKILHGIPVVDFDSFTSIYSPEDCRFIISVGEPADREKMFFSVKNKGYSMTTIVHPNVHVPESTVIGEGTLIQSMVCISPDVIIGENVLLQPMTDIGHDTTIGRSTVCSAYTSISGNCKIGDRTYLAVHVGVREKISIGSDSVVGMCSAVQRDIPDNVIAMGNPARPMKHKDDSKVFK